MNVSFDGTRRNATRAMNGLYFKVDNILKAYSDDICDSDKEELIEAFNNAAQAVDVMNCLYDDSVNGDLNDLSDILSVHNLEKGDEDE